MSETRKLAAILVTDIVGFSRLAGIDEQRTLARIRALRGDLIDPAVAAHHGRIVKGTGDGFIVEFRSVVDAARCAIEIQNGVIERNAGVPRGKADRISRSGFMLGRWSRRATATSWATQSISPRGWKGSRSQGPSVSQRTPIDRSRGGLRWRSAISAPPSSRTSRSRCAPIWSRSAGPDEPLKRRSALRHRRVAALATLAFLVVAGAAGWDSFAGKPSTTADTSMTPPSTARAPPQRRPLLRPHRLFRRRRLSTSCPHGQPADGAVASPDPTSGEARIGQPA